MRVMFGKCSRELVRLWLAEHGAKFQVPVSRLPLPTCLNFSPLSSHPTYRASRVAA